MLCLALVALSQAPPTRALPATMASAEMYSFWCTSARSSSVLCQHHSLVGQMGTTTDVGEKKKISEKIKALLKSSAPPPPASTGMPKPQSPFSKEYTQMKMAFCATNPTGGKAMCSTAASQFKTAGASSTRPGASTSAATQSANEVWKWYCSKPGKRSLEQEQLCSNNSKRTEALDKLRTGLGSSTETRKALLEQLKLTPPAAYATTQAIYAEFCKVSEHAEKLTCARVKATQASKAMREWYCGQPGKAESSDWCLRQKVLEKLQKIPIVSSSVSDADKAQAAERTKLATEYAQYAKPAATGGPSRAAQIAKEITAAKKAYCAMDANKNLAYCKMTSLSSVVPIAPPSSRRLLSKTPIARV